MLSLGSEFQGFCEESANKRLFRVEVPEIIISEQRSLTDLTFCSAELQNKKNIIRADQL